MPTYAYKVRDDMSNGPSRPVSARRGGARASCAGRARRGACGDGAARHRSAAAIRSSSRPTASRPIVPRGCLTVVRLNASQPAMSMSSKPTTERSSGTRDPDAASRVERAEGDEVVGREDRGRPRPRCEKVEPPLVAAVVAELPDTAERVVERRHRGTRGPRGTLLSVAARRRVLRSGDERDAAVPQVEHRLGDRAPSAAVVGDDRVDRVAFDVAVDEDDGDPARAASGQAAFRASPRRRRARRPRRR